MSRVSSIVKYLVIAAHSSSVLLLPAHSTPPLCPPWVLPFQFKETNFTVYCFSKAQTSIHSSVSILVTSGLISNFYFHQALPHLESTQEPEQWIIS